MCEYGDVSIKLPGCLGPPHPPDAGVKEDHALANLGVRRGLEVGWGFQGTVEEGDMVQGREHIMGMGVVGRADGVWKLGDGQMGLSGERQEARGLDGLSASC